MDDPSRLPSQEEIGATQRETARGQGNPLRESAEPSADQAKKRQGLSFLQTVAALIIAVVGLAASAVTIADYWERHPRPGGGSQPVLTVVPNQAANVPEATIPSVCPTPIPVSAADLQFRDDFSSSSGWDPYRQGNSGPGLEDGRYYIKISDTNMLFLSVWPKPGQLDNAILQVDVYGPLGPGGAAAQGLAFGWQPGWKGNAYAFTVDATGVCKFLEASGGWSERMRGTVNGFDPREPHVLQVQIRGPKAIGYIDGVCCATYLMPNYRRGYVGVVASDWEGNGKSYFDEYRVYRLP
jgi:hypothetical protein